MLPCILKITNKMFDSAVTTPYFTYNEDEKKNDSIEELFMLFSCNIDEEREHKLYKSCKNG